MQTICLLRLHLLLSGDFEATNVTDDFQQHSRENLEIEFGNEEKWKTNKYSAIEFDYT